MNDSPNPASQGMTAAQMHAQGIGGGGGSPGQPATDPSGTEGIFSVLTQAINDFAGKFSSALTGVNLTRWGQINTFGGTDLAKGGIQTGNMINAANYAQGPQGGPLAGVFAQVGGGPPDFSKISAPTVGDGLPMGDRLAWADVPHMPDGGFKPSATGGIGTQAGMGMGSVG